MLNSISRTTTLAAISTFDDKAAIYMTANIRTGEAPGISTAYKDIDLYKANKEAADADLEEFKQKVFEASVEK